MIPAHAHFVWIGNGFHWLHWAAVASAARLGGFERVVLHHTDDLAEQRWWRALQGMSAVSTRRLRPTEELEAVHGPALVDRYRALRSPAAQSNVLRLALLARRGGVYLDLDTVTVGALCALRTGAAFFCGAERIAFPAEVRATWNPVPWAQALVRTGVRDVVRRANDGVRMFRMLERYYPVRANNAVLGSERNHPFTRELLRRICELSPRAAQRRFALGTGLLQRALADEPSRPSAGLAVHDPAVFYPLGPELSEHWFRASSRAVLDDIVRPETRVVHWYASVRTRRIVPHLGPAWLAGGVARPPLAQLLARVLEDAPCSAASGTSGAAALRAIAE